MDSGYGAQYRELYGNHWWWRAREHVLRDVLNSLALPASAEIVDFGCGDALAFPLLQHYGRVRGIEVDSALISSDNPYRQDISSAELGNLIYRDWKCDLLTALDVIEHIEDDRTAMAQLVDLLKPGGKMIITVPAFGSLWDAHDVLNRHFRRYRKQQLLQLIPHHARVLRSDYLFHSIFPVKWLLARYNRWRGQQLPQHSIPPAPINTLMRGLLITEYHLARVLHLPFGTSLMVVLERIGAAE